MTGRQFGFECEVVGGTGEVLRHLHDAGLWGSDHLHDYHCDCNDCDPWHGYPIHAQEDCTVDGEFISKVLRYGSREADTVITGLTTALRKARARVGTAGGFHVHVSKEGVDSAAALRLWRLYMRYQDTLAELASAQFAGVRDYNRPVAMADLIGGSSWSEREGRYVTNPATERTFWRDDSVIVRQPSYKGTWLCEREQTYEFRLWNATLAEWRMRLAIGVSVAMVDAAVAGVTVTDRTRRPLVRVLEPFLDDTTFAAVLRQHYCKGGIAA